MRQRCFIFVAAVCAWGAFAKVEVSAVPEEAERELQEILLRPAEGLAMVPMSYQRKVEVLPCIIAVGAEPPRSELIVQLQEKHGVSAAQVESCFLKWAKLRLSESEGRESRLARQSIYELRSAKSDEAEKVLHEVMTCSPNEYLRRNAMTCYLARLSGERLKSALEELLAGKPVLTASDIPWLRVIAWRCEEPFGERPMIAGLLQKRALVERDRECMLYLDKFLLVYEPSYANSEQRRGVLQEGVERYGSVDDYFAMELKKCADPKWRLKNEEWCKLSVSERAMRGRIRWRSQSLSQQLTVGVGVSEHSPASDVLVEVVDKDSVCIETSYASSGDLVLNQIRDIQHAWNLSDALMVSNLVPLVKARVPSAIFALSLYKTDYAKELLQELMTQNDDAVARFYAEQAYAQMFGEEEIKRSFLRNEVLKVE